MVVSRLVVVEDHAVAFGALLCDAAGVSRGPARAVRLLEPAACGALDDDWEGKLRAGPSCVHQRPGDKDALRRCRRCCSDYSVKSSPGRLQSTRQEDAAIRRPEQRQRLAFWADIVTPPGTSWRGVRRIDVQCWRVGLYLSSLVRPWRGAHVNSVGSVINAGSAIAMHRGN